MVVTACAVEVVLALVAVVCVPPQAATRPPSPTMSPTTSTADTTIRRSILTLDRNLPSITHPRFEISSEVTSATLCRSRVMPPGLVAARHPLEETLGSGGVQPFAGGGVDYKLQLRRLRQRFGQFPGDVRPGRASVRGAMESCSSRSPYP